MQMTEKADMRKAMMFLQKYGISLNLGAKIYQKYGESVYSVFRKTRIVLQMISVVWDLKLQMRSRIALEFIQIQITEYEVEWCILFCRLQGRDMYIFRRTSSFRASSRTARCRCFLYGEASDGYGDGTETDP